MSRSADVMRTFSANILKDEVALETTIPIASVFRAVPVALRQMLLVELPGSQNRSKSIITRFSSEANST